MPVMTKTWSSWDLVTRWGLAGGTARVSKGKVLERRCRESRWTSATLRGGKVVVLLQEVVQDLLRWYSKMSVESLRGTDRSQDTRRGEARRGEARHDTTRHETARVEAGRTVQQHFRPVGSQRDRLLLGDCSDVEVQECLCTRRRGTTRAKKGSGNNNDTTRLRGRAHGGAEASHSGATTSTMTTSTKEFAAASSRTASLFRLRSGHGKAGWAATEKVESGKRRESQEAGGQGSESLRGLWAYWPLQYRKSQG